MEPHKARCANGIPRNENEHTLEIDQFDGKLVESFQIELIHSTFSTKIVY
jgi:hypothetical protein